jgi:RNA-binding protein
VQEASSAERKQLRRLAHDLEPVVWIGKEGLSDDLVAATQEALAAHELIKVKLLSHKENRKAVARELADKADCVLAGVIGHVFILYREHPDKDQRRIQLDHS